jgi:PAS domain S-box-containing protein
MVTDRAAAAPDPALAGQVAAGELLGAFRALLEANPTPMWVYDLQTLAFLEVNDAAVAHYGYTREWFTTHTIADIRPESELSSLEDNLRAPRTTLEQSTWQHRLADGRIIDVDIASHPLTWRGRAAVLVTARDISIQQRMLAALDSKALHDPVTGLPAAPLFAERVAEAMLNAPGISLAVVGVERFDELAVALGFSAANEVVREAGRRLLTCCSRDQLVGYLGGGRFAVALPGRRAEQDALRLATSVLGAFEPPFAVGDPDPVGVTASIGIGVGVGLASCPKRLLTQAVAAMRIASAKGGSRYELAHPELGSAALDRFATEQAIRAGLDGDEFSMVFQPEVELSSGRVLGVEALARWRRNDGTQISPTEFIDIAEDSGLIIPLGRMLISKAIRQAASAVLEADAFIAVNVSVRQLADAALLDVILQACREAQVPPTAVCVELTESALMAADDFDALDALLALKHLGARIAIDDFGTGYSALSYLKRLPVDLVKIDRAFVCGLPDCPKDTALAQAVIAVAHAHDLTVVAEGVETGAQLAALRSLGADAAQGYLLSRPVDAIDLRAGLQAAAVHAEAHGAR